MRRYCGGGREPAGCWGVGLILLGAVLLVVSLPSWLWMSVLGLALIAAGFFLLRFG